MPPRPVKRRPAEGQKVCPYCFRSFNVRGYGRHEPACPSRPERQQQPTPILDVEDDRVGSDLSENGTLPIYLPCRRLDSDLHIAGDPIQIAEIAEDYAGVELGQSTEAGGSGEHTLEDLTGGFAHHRVDRTKRTDPECW